MKIVSLPVSGYASNCYLMISGSEALIVDPSASLDILRDAAEKEKVHPIGIVLTHAHYDHLLTLEPVREAFGCPVYIHSADAEALGDPVRNVSGSLFRTPQRWKEADILLEEGSTIPVGDERVSVLHTPGHTPGCICLRCGEILISGDTIFAHGYGRFDLPGGDAAVLAKTLHSLAGMDPDLIIYPGHGPSARLGDALRRLGIG